jgi:hypothetical protein
MAPNSALVTDACAAALRAFYSAAQRGRSAPFHLSDITRQQVSCRFRAPLFVLPGRPGRFPGTNRGK